MAMNTKKLLWWLGLVIAILTTIVTYCSCTAGITFGKSNRIEQTVTNNVDSVITSFSIIPNK